MVVGSRGLASLELEKRHNVAAHMHKRSDILARNRHRLCNPATLRARCLDRGFWRTTKRPSHHFNYDVMTGFKLPLPAEFKSLYRLFLRSLLRSVGNQYGPYGNLRSLFRPFFRAAAYNVTRLGNAGRQAQHENLRLWMQRWDKRGEQHHTLWRCPSLILNSRWYTRSTGQRQPHSRPTIGAAPPAVPFALVCKTLRTLTPPRWFLEPTVVARQREVPDSSP